MTATTGPDAPGADIPKPWMGPWRIEWNDVVVSTMDLARVGARGDAPSGSVYAAREQTEGRGRSGRSWTSPRGGLYASVLLCDPPRGLAPLLPLAGGLAVRDALAGIAPEADFLVKWPNDVLAVVTGDEAEEKTRGGEKQVGKIAGVLTEAGAVGPRLDWVVIGLGVNLAVPPEALPRDVDPPAVSLTSIGIDPPPLEEALGCVLDALASSLSRHGKHPDGLISAVRPHLAYRGARIRVERSSDPSIEGVVEDLGSTGELVLRTEEGERRVTAWDAVRSRPV